MPVTVGRCSGLQPSTTLGGGVLHVRVRDVRAGSARGQDRRIQEANRGHVLSAFTPVACSDTLSFHHGSLTWVNMGNALGWWCRNITGQSGRCREFKAETSLLVERRESSGGGDVWRSKCLWTVVCKDHQAKSWEMGPVVGLAGASLSGGRSLGFYTAQLNRIIYANILSIVRIIEGWQVVGFQVEPC